MKCSLRLEQSDHFNKQIENTKKYQTEMELKNITTELKKIRVIQYQNRSNR